MQHITNLAQFGWCVFTMDMGGKVRVSVKDRTVCLHLVV